MSSGHTGQILGNSVVSLGQVTRDTVVVSGHVTGSGQVGGVEVSENPLLLESITLTTNLFKGSPEGFSSVP